MLASVSVKRTSSMAMETNEQEPTAALGYRARTVRD